MRKAPPQYTSTFVFHPEQDAEYRHFENALEHPFIPDPTGGLPRVNAWWLAEAALLSYWAPDQAKRIFADAGLKSDFVTENSTDCYVAWRSDAVIVAFRGTQSAQWQDILADAKIAHVPWTTGSVHRGFRDALDKVWRRLEDTIDRVGSGKPVWFCGHSLGGALATLAADRFPGKNGLCTFGSPRVGDPTFASAFNGKFAGRSVRFVNDHDVVTHVPPPLPLRYEHVDDGRFIASDGHVSGRSPEIIHFFSDLIGERKHLLEVVEGLDKAKLQFTPTFLLDHMPKSYAIWTWNDYAANRSVAGPTRRAPASHP